MSRSKLIRIPKIAYKNHLKITSKTKIYLRIFSSESIQTYFQWKIKIDKIRNELNGMEKNSLQSIRNCYKVKLKSKKSSQYPIVCILPHRLLQNMFFIKKIAHNNPHKQKKSVIYVTINRIH